MASTLLAGLLLGTLAGLVIVAGAWLGAKACDFLAGDDS